MHRRELGIIRPSQEPGECRQAQPEGLFEEDQQVTTRLEAVVVVVVVVAGCLSSKRGNNSHDKDGIVA